MTANAEADPAAAVAHAAALPRARVVHADPGTPPTCEQEPLPEAVTRRPMDSKSAAEWAYERIILYIRNFESQLDAAQEVAMGYAGGEAGVLKIEGLGFFEPDIVTFYGRDAAGMKTQLIQHVAQLSVMLRAVPKLASAEPARRIGFRLASGWTGGESGDGSA